MDVFFTKHLVVPISQLVLRPFEATLVTLFGREIDASPFGDILGISCLFLEFTASMDGYINFLHNRAFRPVLHKLNFFGPLVA